MVLSSRSDALDGLRLLAVAAVMAFHFGAPHAQGGFLGVDIFFVLSGFLITSVLLGQVQERRVRPIDFWARRARRLIPALVPVIVLTVIWGATFAPAVTRDGLRGDITSTLLYFANWHFIATSSYFASDGVASPLQHMWSLGVEEQFYLVWPLLLGVVAMLPRRWSLPTIAVVAGLGIILSAVRLEALWSVNRDRAYLGSDSRIFEPLAGALLAVLLTSDRLRKAVTRGHLPLVLFGAAGIAWGVATLNGSSAVYAHGGAVVVTAGAASVIAALATGTSRVTAVLAAAPMAYLGRLSYGMYLWHWPLQVWTRPGAWWDLSALGSAGRALMLTLMTVAVAAISYKLIEVPIRYGRISRFLLPRRTLATTVVALGALVLVDWIAVVPRAGAVIGNVTKTILLVGDSVPQRLAPALAAAAATDGYVVVSATRGSCPATGVAVVGPDGKPWGAGNVCASDVPARQDAAVVRYRPSLVIWWSRYELADRVDARGHPVAFASRAYWTLQRKAFAVRTAALTREGARVVAVQIEPSGLGMATRCTPTDCGPFLARLVHATGARTTWNRFLASHTNGSVRSISIDDLVCRSNASPCDDRMSNGMLARPDGTHYSAAAAPAVARAVIDRSLAAAKLGPRR